MTSIAFHYASTITYTFIDYYTSTCTYVDGCIFASTTLSSHASFYVVYAFTKCYSITSSSSNSSMNTKSTNVAPSLICFLAHQCRLLLCKKSIAYVPIVSMSWIIVYTILRKPIMVLSFLLQDLNHSSPSKLMDLLWNKLLDTIFINVYAIFFGSPYLCVTFNHNWELNMVMFLLVYPSNAFYIEFAIPKP